MALTVPVSLALGRFKQISQRTQEVWQGGLVRLPMWVAHPTDLSTSVTVVDDLPAVREVLTRLEEDSSGGRRIPGLLEVPGVTPEHLRAFAHAAASFYQARIWDHLTNEDLIIVDAPSAPKAMRHLCVLGNGGEQFGLAFFDSRKVFDRLVNRTGRAAIPTHAYGVTFGTLDELPFADVDAWQDLALPVASRSAYPLVADLHRDGTARRPDARELTFAEALLSALADTTEDELDAGRWQKQVRTSDGTVTIAMTLPALLEAENGHRSAPNPAIMPRIAERGSVRIKQLLEGRSLESLDEVNAEIDRAQEAGLFDEPGLAAGRELTPLERAQELAYDAMESEGRLRVKRAREALAISPDCADAWVILAEEAPTLDIALERYEQAVAAGERAIGPDRFDALTGEFWGELDTRPYMRARLGLAQTLGRLGRGSEAVDHYRELLRLNPGDNQGVRYMLVVELLSQNRDDEAGAVLGEHADDIQALWPYAQVLWRFRTEGATAATRADLETALHANPHVLTYLLDPDAVPREQPAYFGLGSREEAVYVEAELGDLYDRTPGLMEWLRSTSSRLRVRSQKRRKTRSSR